MRQSASVPDRPAYVGIIGPGDPAEGAPGDLAPGDLETAAQVGRLLAAHGAVLVCGGLGGVMRAACRGARGHDPAGVTVGLLPGRRHGEGNEFLSVEIPTGLGELRNGLVVGAAEAVIAVGGSWGTLSEISLAMRTGKPVVQIGGWTLAPVPAGPAPRRAADAADAVAAALAAVRESRRRSA